MDGYWNSEETCSAIIQQYNEKSYGLNRIFEDL